MEKTIKEWLETLPEPYRSEAIANMPDTAKDHLECCLGDAIEGAFTWAESKQGYGYWLDIVDRAEAGEFNTSSLDKDSEK